MISQKDRLAAPLGWRESSTRGARIKSISSQSHESEDEIVDGALCLGVYALVVVRGAITAPFVSRICFVEGFGKERAKEIEGSSRSRPTLLK